MLAYRIEYKSAGRDTWEIYKSLTRNRDVGFAFDTRKCFPEGTHRQVIKRYYWKTYKIDIDRLPDWQRFVECK